MEKQFIIDTAKYICSILNCHQTIIMSWGAERFRATIYNNMAALRFSVNGFLHRGDVVVAYNKGSDLFELYCLDPKGNPIHSTKEVYFDELVDKLDKMVETKANDAQYHRQIEEWLTSSNDNE